jgi:uncharacterized phage-associated protein
MAVSAHDVAAELRRRLPGIGAVKLHKLLYYVQGHHLAHSDAPLFGESIAAWDMGPIVGALWAAEKAGESAPPPRELDEAALNTIGYVVSRYGSLTGNDLINLTHGEKPWQTADATRGAGQQTTIRVDWIRDYFRTEGAPDVGDEEQPLDAEAVRAWLSEVAAQPPGPGVSDSVESIRARMTTRA